MSTLSDHIDIHSLGEFIPNLAFHVFQWYTYCHCHSSSNSIPIQSIHLTDGHLLLHLSSIKDISKELGTCIMCFNKSHICMQITRHMTEFMKMISSNIFLHHWFLTFHILSPTRQLKETGFQHDQNKRPFSPRRVFKFIITVLIY